MFESFPINNNEGEQQNIAEKYLELNSLAEEAGQKTKSVLESLDRNREESPTDFDGIEEKENSFKELYSREQKIREEMSVLFDKMSEDTKEKYLKG